MADEEKDKSQQTEEPTEKRKQDAREDGQLPVSKELSSWCMLAVGTIILFGMGPGIGEKLKVMMLPFFEGGETIPFDHHTTSLLFNNILGNLLKTLGLPALFFVATALLIGFLQTKFNFSSKSLAPKGERISLLSGIQRLISAKSLIEFLKSVLKMAIIGSVGIYVFWPLFNHLESFQDIGLSQILPNLYKLSLKTFIAVLCVTLILAILDVVYQRFSHLQSLRMSKQEVKEEHKESEGDPHVKQRQRQIRMDKARKRMMAAVPTASVVVTNPQHYAVALKYEEDTMDAPVVVAKGMDFLALKIREIAKENDISIVENPPLARALYSTVEIDEEIPFEHYQAVAEVIRYVMQTKRKRF